MVIATDKEWDLANANLKEEEKTGRIPCRSGWLVSR